MNDEPFHLIIWADRQTWVPWLTAWLRHRLKRRALSDIRKTKTSGLYPDDPEWLILLEGHLRGPIESVQLDLAKKLSFSTVSVVHGCRTEDAGSYYREGLRVHDRKALVEQFRGIVDRDSRLKDIRSRFDELVASIDSTIDEGRCFVALDSRSLLEHGA